MSEYVVLLPGNETTWQATSQEERAAVYARHIAFSEALAARGHTVTGGAELTLARAGKVVRRGPDGAAVVTDGPYAESAEQLSGFYSVQSEDLDDLLQVCAILAGADDGVEVRGTVDHSGGAA
ncbi:MAG: YciI family protein [Nocardioides sp.]|nr:YciI family protein [Nocardioides sp.]